MRRSCTEKGFEAKVLTHLEYIKKKQDEHDKKFEDINTKMDVQRNAYEKRFGCIEKDIDTAKGFAKGAMVAGGAGFFGGVLSWIRGG